MVTRIRPQNINLKVPDAELLPSFVGMLRLDSNNILRVDTVGAGTLADFVTVLPQHTVTGEHGPKVTITQTADDNALAITKGGLNPAISIVVTGPTAGRGISITSASNTNFGMEIQQNGNADALHIEANGTGRALFTEDGDVLFDDGNVAIANGQLRVNTDRLFVSTTRVGIGTTAPDRLLDVRGGAAFKGDHLYLVNPSAPATKKSWGMVVNTVSGILSLGTAADVLPAGGLLTQSVVQIEPGAPSNVVYIESSGQMGIGTAAPGAKLEVESAANEHTVFIDKNGGSSNALQISNDGTGFGLRIDNNTTEEAVYIRQIDPTGDEAIQIDNFGAGDGILIQNLVANASNALDARSLGTGPVIHIHSSGSGRDIEGTNTSWWVDRNGNASFNNVYTKVASGTASGSDTFIINFSAGTSTGGSYIGDTGFSSTPHFVMGPTDSGLHDNTDHHRWTLTVSSLTSTSATVSVTRNDVSSFLGIRWLAVGT